MQLLKKGYFKRLYIFLVLFLLTEYTHSESTTQESQKYTVNSLNQSSTKTQAPSKEDDSNNTSLIAISTEANKASDTSTEANKSPDNTSLLIDISTEASGLSTRLDESMATEVHDDKSTISTIVQTDKEGNATMGGTKTAVSLNPVIIIMIVILACITILSISGGLFVLCSKTSSKGRMPLVECPSELDVSRAHHYQRNSIMVMFDQTTTIDGPRASDATALSKVRAAFLAAGGDPGSRRGSAIPPLKSGFENIGYDKGCEA